MAPDSTPRDGSGSLSRGEKQPADGSQTESKSLARFRLSPGLPQNLLFSSDFESCIGYATRFNAWCNVWRSACPRILGAPFVVASPLRTVFSASFASASEVVMRVSSRKAFVASSIICGVRCFRSAGENRLSLNRITQDLGRGHALDPTSKRGLGHSCIF